MKELEAENAKLKRMYAELTLENAAIKDVPAADNVGSYADALRYEDGTLAVGANTAGRPGAVYITSEALRATSSHAANSYPAAAR